MGVVNSLDATLNRNTGTFSSPTWAEVENIKDLTLDLSASEADVSTRASDWRQIKATLQDVTVTFQMLYDTADADWTAFHDAFINKTNIDLFVADGASGTNGTEGLHAEFTVTQFSVSEALEDVLLCDITCRPAKPGTAGDDPEWLTISV